MHASLNSSSLSATRGARAVSWAAAELGRVRRPRKDPRLELSLIADAKEPSITQASTNHRSRPNGPSPKSLACHHARSASTPDCSAPDREQSHA